MRRYPELMKRILLSVKNSKKPLRSTDICIPGYSIAEIVDHVHVLIRSEHLQGTASDHCSGHMQFDIIEEITDRGLEYLIIADQITNERSLVQFLNRPPKRELPQLQSKILVTDDPGEDYPIQYFNLVIIIEPDEEEWIPHPDSEDDNPDIQQPWDIQCEMLENEIDEESEFEATKPRIKMADKTEFLWLRNYLFNYYGDFAYENASIIFRRDYESFDPPENMMWFLQSAYIHHPEWRVAIIGGLFEDEVTSTANIIREIGFSATILTRYCLSVNGFKQFGGNVFSRMLPPNFLMDD